MLFFKIKFFKLCCTVLHFIPQCSTFSLFDFILVTSLKYIFQTVNVFSHHNNCNPLMYCQISYVQWMAPEVLLGKDYTESADVFR